MSNTRVIDAATLTDVTARIEAIEALIAEKERSAESRGRDYGYSDGVGMALKTIADFDAKTPKIRELYYKVEKLIPVTYTAAHSSTDKEER